MHFTGFHVLKLCNSSLTSGNRLPMRCNRLPEMKSLEIPLLLACSVMGRIVLLPVVRFLVKESTLFLLFLVDRDGGATNP